MGVCIRAHLIFLIAAGFAMAMAMGCSPPTTTQRQRSTSPRRSGSLASSTSSPSGAPPSTAADATNQVALAIDIDVYEKPHGSPLVAHITEGLVLERRDDGYVRIKTNDVTDAEGHGNMFVGYFVPREHSLEHDIGFYAASDVAITNASGASLGTAYRGAFLPLVRFVDKDTAEVALVPFGKNATGRVLRSALATTRTSAPDPKLYKQTAPHRSFKVMAPGGEMLLPCDDAPIGVLGEREDGAVLAQAIRGIEITGLATHSGRPCQARAVRTQSKRDAEHGPPVIPFEFKRTTPFRSTAFASSREFWIIEETPSETLTCSKWSFRREGKGKPTIANTRLIDGLGLSELAVGGAPAAPKKGGTESMTLTYVLENASPLIVKPTQLEFADAQIVNRSASGEVILGSKDGRGEGAALCGNRTAVVLGETADGVMTLPDTYAEIMAFHPDDVEMWFTKREACTAVVAKHSSKKSALVLFTVAPSGC